MTDIRPSQIADAISPAAIRADRFGTGILTMKYTAICTISAIALQIRQSTTLAECAMALTTGSEKPSRLRPSAMAAAGSRIVVADQLKFIVRRDAGVDEQVCHDRHDCGAEIDQESRQAGERLQDHVRPIDRNLNRIICYLRPLRFGIGFAMPRRNVESSGTGTRAIVVILTRRASLC